MSGNFEKFRKLLDELFQFDQADLDFGLYRILNAKRQEISRFLDQELLPEVRNALSAYEQQSRAALAAELEKAEAEAQKLGLSDPTQAPKVRELRARYEAAPDREATENEIYSHLYNFFRRYYSEGDFISQRRYKEGVYAIPYEGEEVKLYWANYDQYYVKTSEYLRNYTFKLPSGRRVHFKLVDADTEKDNVKPAAGAERRFLYKSVATIPGPDGRPELVFQFEFKPDPEKKKQAERNAEALPRMLADAAALLGPSDLDLLGELKAPSPTEKNPKRTLLEKHLSEYTARNTFDYFIHKDLGGFLRRELDFYIKNEVMHLDDIDRETAAPRVEQYLAQIKAMRRVAHKIIDFLAQIENFQKKLWLKKKFVVETHYCVTLGRILAIEDEKTRDWLIHQIIKNDAQRAEWVRLFAIDEIKGDLTAPGYSEPLTPDFLKAHPTLVVDTRHFDEAFKLRLLSAIPDLDEEIDGLLIDGENFQALNLLHARYRKQVKCIYIDPPYNTGQSQILYKNLYKHSSWLSLMQSRVSIGREFLSANGMQCTTIDDTEFHRLRELLAQVFGEENIAGVVAIKNNPSGRSTVKGFSIAHEYAIFSSSSPDVTLGMIPRTQEQLSQYPEEDEQGRFQWRSFLRAGGANDFRTARPRLHYPLVVAGGEVRIPKMEWSEKDRRWTVVETLRHDEEIIWPVVNGTEYTWRLGVESLEKRLADLRVRRTRDGRIAIEVKFRLDEEGVLSKTVWDEKQVNATAYGTTVLRHIMGESQTFSFPKSVYAVEKSLRVCSGSDIHCLILDYFAGSGTTGHAVINLNREDGGRRKFILVEMGEYFDTVLVPRIKKVIFTPEWKDGKPKRMPTPEEIERGPRLLKILRLESYEDTLNNLSLSRTKAQDKTLFDTEHKDFRETYTLHYMLDVETRGSASLLNVDRFEDPFAYTLEIATGTVGETKPVAVDLVETFNYLIGLRVKTIDDIRGVRVVTGISPQGERVLILWRRTNEIDSEALNTWFEKQAYNTRDQEYDVIYVNGDNHLENLRRPDQTWKVRLIEEEFRRRMFDVQDV
jgi:adenine-specific DNA-methyltransferase